MNLDVLHPPIAHYPPRAKDTRLNLHGGPLDGWEVGVEESAPATVQVNGPRHGDHTIWVWHIYSLRGGRYEHSTTVRLDFRTYA